MSLSFDQLSSRLSIIRKNEMVSAISPLESLGASIISQVKKQQTVLGKAVEVSISTIASFPMLISTLMESRNIAHKLHLATGSYAKHMALNDLYEALPDLIDSLTEGWQGKHEVIPTYPTPEVISTSNPISFIDSLNTYFMTNRKAIPSEDTELQNIADEIQTLINSTSYKLKNLS